MRFLILALPLLCAACAPQYTERTAEPNAKLPVNEARFAERPELLHMAFRDSCQGPTDSYANFGANRARCQMIPPPDVAAGLLVRFDGALDIPKIIVERETRAADDGFVVGISYFATVPKKSGASQRVYLRSRDLDRTIENLFRAFGGTPI